jgi:uncharacterized linocin/CFP29 family protein
LEGISGNCKHCNATTNISLLFHTEDLGFRGEDLDDLLGLLVTQGAVHVFEGRQCAPGDALGRPHHPLESLQLQTVQTPYQVVIQPDRMHSMVRQ